MSGDERPLVAKGSWSAVLQLIKEQTRFHSMFCVITVTEDGLGLGGNPWGEMLADTSNRFQAINKIQTQFKQYKMTNTGNVLKFVGKDRAGYLRVFSSQDAVRFIERCLEVAGQNES